MTVPSVHFVIGAYPPSIGGAQIHTRALAQELAGRGAAVRVSCHWRETRTDWVLGTTARLPAGRQREMDGAVAVDRVGLHGGPVRSPLLPLDAQQSEVVDELLRTALGVTAG